MLLITVLSFFAIVNSQSNSDTTTPQVNPSVTKGLVIDAGSGGSRLHVFTWQPRIFKTLPPPISYPESNEKWTVRNDPGIHTYAEYPSKVSEHLIPLIDFAKIALNGNENDFQYYPIYFKATGGMRELELSKREEIIHYVRKFLSDKSFCPFYFRDDFARVISGEEEAIFSWTATNFLMGSLLPASQGLGNAEPLNSTYGTLDLGGSSTQIAFYVPSQDISEGLFKLQIGSQKYWNVYTKSFLQFGVVSARKRHLLELADHYFVNHNYSTTYNNNPNNNNDNKNSIPSIVNYCFHSGYSEHGATSDNKNIVDISGPELPLPNQIELCKNELRALMEKRYGKFCNNVYHGDCSIAGAYQPPLPDGKHGHFIGTSSYSYPWKFLMLPQTATLELFEEKATNICKMNFAEIVFYFESNNLNVGSSKLTEFIPYYCFLTSYVLVLLQDGYGFRNNQTLTVLDEVNGNKVGWALGAILFEINTLPWSISTSVVGGSEFGGLVLAAAIGFAFGLIIAILIYRETIHRDHSSGNFYNGSATSESTDIYSDVQRITSMELIRNAANNNHQSQNNHHNDYHMNNNRHNNSHKNQVNNSWVSSLMEYSPFSLPKREYQSIPQQNQRN
eukprot:gene15106-20325_t